MSDDGYYILDRGQLPNYLGKISTVTKALGLPGDFSEDAVTIEEIGDGNVNYVYRVGNASDPSRQVIVKQAVPYFRLVGEAWPLSRDRMTYEIRALNLYNEIVPDLVPTIFHADEGMSTVVMECLSAHIILRGGMIEGKVYPKVAADIGRFMAETMFKTSAWAMPSLARRQLMDKFTLNDELCKLSEEFIFTFPYMPHESNYSNPAADEWAKSNLHTDSQYKLDVLHFKNLFVTRTDALVHGDLHTGSLMVNEEESYVIDMEFAFFGPFGFDVGKIISNFLLSCSSHYVRLGGSEYREWLLDQIGIIWTSFERCFIEQWEQAAESTMLTVGLLTADEFTQLKSKFMLEMLRDMAGFCACSMARRTVGIAGVADVRDIEDPLTRSQLEILNLSLSKHLMADRHTFSSIDDLVASARSLYATFSI